MPMSYVPPSPAQQIVWLGLVVQWWTRLRPLATAGALAKVVADRRHAVGDVGNAPARDDPAAGRDAPGWACRSQRLVEPLQAEATCRSPRSRCCRDAAVVSLRVDHRVQRRVLDHHATPFAEHGSLGALARGQVVDDRGDEARGHVAAAQTHQVVLEQDVRASRRLVDDLAPEDAAGARRVVAVEDRHAARRSDRARRTPPSGTGRKSLARTSADASRRGRAAPRPRRSTVRAMVLQATSTVSASSVRTAGKAPAGRRPKTRSNSSTRLLAAPAGRASMARSISSRCRCVSRGHVIPP